VEDASPMGRGGLVNGAFQPRATLTILSYGSGGWKSILSLGRVNMSVGAIGSTNLHTSALKVQGATGQATAAQARHDLPPIEDMPTRESLARDSAAFAADVNKFFREAGIRVPPNPVLGNDSQGYVQVANDHPDKERIERLFKEKPELQQRYVKISNGSSLLRAAEGHHRMMAEYEHLEGNTSAQKALVESTIARNKAPFFMSITANGAETFFSESISV
jgi:hypothetical protein